MARAQSPEGQARQSRHWQTLHVLWERMPHGGFGAMLVLMVVVGLTEGVGVLLLVPLLGVLEGAKDGPAWVAVIQAPLHWLGLEPNAAVLLSLFVLLLLLRSVGQYWRDKLGAVLQFNVVDDLRQACFEALLHAEWRWLSHKCQADNANLLLNDVNRVGVGLHFAIGLLASLATGAAWMLAAMFLSWPMTLLALCSGGLLWLTMSDRRRGAVRLGVSLGQANRALQGEAQEALQGVRWAKILSSEDRHLNGFIKTVQRVRQQQLAFTTGTHLVRAGTHVVGGLILSVYLYLGLNFGQVSVAQLLILVMIFARLIPLLMNTQQQFHQCLHAWPALEEAEQLLAECAKYAEPAMPPGQGILPVKHEITVERVTVRYAQREQAALHEVSLVLPAFTTTAVMGASGSGKSTLADVVMGLLMPDEGIVRLDGQALDASNRMRWRRSVAYVSQDVFLFHETIRENLLLACPDATELDCLRALKMAAADFVLDLPQGIDTLVGDGGVRLSGGERQRIALARALLGRPSLLILDEATSALDTENEARIRQAIEAMHGQLTTLIIGHRLPTLEHADQVIRLDKGRLVVQGTWAQVRDPSTQIKA
jgi:ATP-binding cassette subfamily C protein